MDDVIKLIGNNEPNLGSVYFLPALTEEQKNIIPITLYIHYESVTGNLNNENLLTLIIKGKLSDNFDDPIEEETVTGIQILTIKNEVRNLKDIFCITNYISKEKDSEVILKCAFPFSEEATLEINIDESGYSNYVQFNRLDNIEINQIGEKEEKEDDDENNDISQKTPNDDDNNSNIIIFHINNLINLFIYIFISIF